MVIRNMNTGGMNRHRPKIFVPASDEQLDRLSVNDCLVPYQAGGINLSQVFRECRWVSPDEPLTDPQAGHQVQKPARR
jgi:hypothetical protein